LLKNSRWKGKHTKKGDSLLFLNLGGRRDARKETQKSSTSIVGTLSETARKQPTEKLLASKTEMTILSLVRVDAKGRRRRRQSGLDTANVLGTGGDD